jgi:hypothetical protein
LTSTYLHMTPSWSSSSRRGECSFKKARYRCEINTDGRCAVCKELEPLYAETASIVATNSSDIRFARVNCVEQNELCETYETPMYPTLRLFQGVERETVYNGPRESAEYVPRCVHRWWKSYKTRTPL